MYLTPMADIPKTPFTSADEPFRIMPLSIPRDWDWISQELACHVVEDTNGLIAVDSDGNYAAAIVCDSFTETACCTHIVIKKPLVIRRGFLQIAAKAIFVYGKRHVIIGMTPANNIKALEFNRRIGWVEVHRIRDGYAFGVDYVMQEMRREDCRWLAKEDRYHG